MQTTNGPQRNWLVFDTKSSYHLCSGLTQIQATELMNTLNKYEFSRQNIRFNIYADNYERSKDYVIKCVELTECNK